MDSKLPSQQSLKTFIAWYKLHRKSLLRTGEIIELINEVDDFLDDYGPMGN